MADGMPHAASTTCGSVVPAGRPPAAWERPRAAGTACDACAGGPPAAEGKSPATSTACARVVTVSRSA